MASRLTRLIRRTVQHLTGRHPRCEQARILTPRFGERHLYIERCRLDANHRGDHQPGLPEPAIPTGQRKETDR